MGESVTEPAEPPSTAPSANPAGHDELEEIRRVLVGPEQRQIRDIVARLDDRPAQTRELSRVLPDALALRANDPQLTRALAPSVEEAITASVRRNPHPVADALFPVMGPAIRKAIAHTLSAMMESLNRTVDQSLSWRSLRWRVTAWRTGKPFAEVVLLNTLAFRVEQVFLIHRESGLLLQHVALPDAPAQDGDMVSAMLTAIRDFVRDSFGGDAEQGLDAFRVGETAVIVEQGPHAVLAAVVRGTPPPGLRVQLKEALESVHLQRGEELQAYSGDSAPFETVRPVLQDCLQTQFKPGERTTSWRRWAWAAAAVLLLLLVWTGFKWRDRARFDDYLARLQAEPGLLVVASGQRDGRFVVGGLRDPQAADPVAMLAASKLDPSQVEQRWEPYDSHHAAFVLTRARSVLAPPPSVQLDVRDGVLSASGTAGTSWIVEARRVAALIPGVARFDAGRVVDEELQRVAGAIRSTSLRFPKGRSQLAAGQSAVVEGVRSQFASLDQAARLLGTRFAVRIVGHADADGTEDENLPLSRTRALVVRDLLGLPALRALEVSTDGVGSNEPLTPGVSEPEKQQNRRVSFRLDLGAAAGAPAAPPSQGRP
jgi:OOP family OmpA-OmpF porin